MGRGYDGGETRYWQKGMSYDRRTGHDEDRYMTPGTRDKLRLVCMDMRRNDPLVNALCLGVLRHEDIHLANATGVGNKVVLFGARTGGDGIGGASILASETFEDGVPAKRPSVQVGDPFREKLLLEACLELLASGCVAGIQDMGAAGLTCSTCETASRGREIFCATVQKIFVTDSLSGHKSEAK